MTSVLPLVILAAVATAITLLLERGGRGGYGWVTGSEFALIGVAVGPIGLDAISGDLLQGVQPVVQLAVAWLGLRFGLRLRPSALAPLPYRTRLAGLVEPVVSLLLLRGLLELLIRLNTVPLDSATAWAVAAVGSATTKSAVAWARSSFGAQGSVSDALEVLSTLDDGVLILAAGLLLPRLGARLPAFAAHAWEPALATLAIGVALAVLVTLMLGRGEFREDLGWIALFGACALATGLCRSLHLAPVTGAALAGAFIGWLSPHADGLEELTRSTERPAVLVLLLLGGASVHLGWTVLAIGVGGALLRIPAKLGGGLASMKLLPEPAQRRDLGAGLLGAGGVAFAVAVALAPELPDDRGDWLLATAVAMALLGDFVGSPLLRALLSRSGEFRAAAPAEVRA